MLVYHVCGKCSPLCTGSIIALCHHGCHFWVPVLACCLYVLVRAATCLTTPDMTNKCMRNDPLPTWICLQADIVYTDIPNKREVATFKQRQQDWGQLQIQLKPYLLRLDYSQTGLPLYATLKVFPLAVSNEAATMTPGEAFPNPSMEDVEAGKFRGSRLIWEEVSSSEV